MTDLDTPDAGEASITDGRVARRHRNINAVIDVVFEMFAEESMFPTMEQVATRSGLSLRSLYRYFADPGELLEAVIARNRADAAPIMHLDAIGRGPFEGRLDAFVDMRLRLYAHFGPTYRATIANAERHPRIKAERMSNRDALRRQFELQFAPELEQLQGADREAALVAGDLLTQLDSLVHLDRYREVSPESMRTILTTALTKLLLVSRG